MNELLLQILGSLAGLGLGAVLVKLWGQHQIKQAEREFMAARLEARRLAILRYKADLYLRYQQSDPLMLKAHLDADPHYFDGIEEVLGQMKQEQAIDELWERHQAQIQASIRALKASKPGADRGQM